MTDKELKAFMDNTVKPIKKMIKARIKTRQDAMAAFDNGLLENLPESVRVIRENENVIQRAIIREQQDLLEVLDLMYPDA